ncbi:hypothetical protein JCM11641_003341 [Rhodosporidiobolus odoratus]
MSTILNTPSSSTTITASPVASTSQDRLLHCSQCKKDKRASDFPTRLINLQPYQVCLAHAWYWTPPKRAQWAPTETKNLEEVCSEVHELKQGREGAQDKWTIRGGPEERAVLVNRLASAGDWTSTAISVRKSEAKSDSPPHPTFQYTLSPTSDDSGTFYKLVLYYHAEEGKYSLTLRPVVNKKEKRGPWARPERIRSKVKGGVEETEGMIEDRAVAKDEEAAAETKVKGKGKGKGRGRKKKAEETQAKEETGAEASSSLDILADVVSAAQEDIVVGGPVSARSTRERDVSVDSLPSRSSREMPPPPIPIPRRPKKARRVEPSLVSTTSATRSGPSSPQAASSPVPNSWAALLSFPSLAAPVQPTPSLSTSVQPIQPLSAGAFDYSNDSAILALLNSFPTTPSSSTTAPSSALPPAPHQPLTLQDLLANPAFDPPNIPLPPRQPLPTALVSLPKLAPNPNAPRIASRLRISTSSREGYESQEGMKAGSALDEAVAAALGSGQDPSEGEGARKRSFSVATEGEGSQDEEGEVGYYEDSISDRSSIDDDNDEDDEGEAGEETEDVGSASSFFESSADEMSELGYSGSGEEEGEGLGEGEEEDEDEEEEEDWLAGFVQRQMPGLTGEMDLGQGEEGEDENLEGESEEEEEEEEPLAVGGMKSMNEVDELDELESGSESG